MSSSSVPAWLQKAHNHDHITTVLQVLADRERSRIRARSSSTSRYRTSISLVHRVAQITSTPRAKGQLVDYYSIAAGCSPENQHCNRYSDIEPYDRTRADAGDRYLNANWVRELAGGRWTIATQAPLPNTVHEFLSIIAGLHSPLIPPGEAGLTFTRVRTVVQLTQNFESGRQKANAYFPPTAGESWVVRPQQETDGLSPLKVTLVKSEEIESAHCVASMVSVAPVIAGVPKPAVIFRHLLYSAWPDHGVPEPRDRAGLLNFIRLVDRTNKDLSGLEAKADAEPPIMVNCSAGVGRTGSFIALCSLLRSNNILSLPPNSSSATQGSPCPPSPLGPLPESVSWDEVAQEIDSLREQRPGMVQRPEQAVLVYEVLVGAFIAKDTVVHGQVVPSRPSV
ncbi:protein-tyrosine phosphatase-like protein [Gloeopeniophorella convolvens]|nr:protein-tyrosine phosphatase-like protein [Gloeopeniophorella convolvens]